MKANKNATLVAHIDCSSGVSGDKFLGALLDAGQFTQNSSGNPLETPNALNNKPESAESKPPTKVSFTVEHLQALATSMIPEAHIEVSTTSSYGIRAMNLTVTEKTNKERTYSDICALIKAVPTDILPIAAANNALLVFENLASAEAHVHNVAIEKVHFHEVGAADSIIDIVGTCLGLAKLGIKELYSTPPALGSGTVRAAHGVLPVPAPATAQLLATHHIPTSTSTATGELTTPTGAALLTLATAFGPVPPLVPQLLGYGAGTRDIGQANVCRVMAGKIDTATLPISPDETTLLETNIDHIAPEAIACAGEQLLAEGALDVWITPIAMKKGRSALTLSVLSKCEDAQRFAQRIMLLTSSLGVRVTQQHRFITQRETVNIDTVYGPVTFKVGAGRMRAEHEDVARISKEFGIDYQQVICELSRVEICEEK